MINFKPGDEIVLENAAIWNQRRIYEVDEISADKVVLTFDGFHYTYDVRTFYWMQPRLAGEFD